jgi:hypothetical protein
MMTARGCDVISVTGLCMRYRTRDVLRDVTRRRAEAPDRRKRRGLLGARR